MSFTRRGLAASAVALAATPALAGIGRRGFPRGFYWGAATAGHQVEGNNTNADVWVLENVRPTLYAQRSGDANDSFELWGQDLALVKQIGLNSYRFSLEWARIEPDQGQFSIAMLDHYQRIIETCHDEGITPIVTFNHFTTPRWFARQGGWTHADSPALFTRFCDRAARHLAQHIGMATTLNEPNLIRMQGITAPAARAEQQRQMLAAAARAEGVAKFVAGNASNPEDADLILAHQTAAHAAGRAAIKSVRPDLKVGVSLAMIDEQAAPGGGRLRDETRTKVYSEWLAAVRQDDFLGVQNYERAVWGPDAKSDPAPNSVRNDFRGEVYAPSLAGAVRYAHQVTGLPILVTEHGIVTRDDTIRARFIPDALRELKGAMDEGIPVLGYTHWSLVDNFEWSLGYFPKFGLASIDRTTFQRTLKPSARTLGRIARQNAL